MGELVLAIYLEAYANAHLGGRDSALYGLHMLRTQLNRWEFVV